MNYLDPLSSKYTDNATLNGRFFELLASVYLEFPFELNAKNKNNKIEQIQLTRGEREKHEGTWKEFLISCSKLSSCSNTTLPRKLLIPGPKNQPIIDLMDSKDRAYQITVGKKHDIKKSKIQKLLEILKATQQNPLKLYFVVPEHNFAKFEWSYTGDLKNLDPEVLKIENKTCKKLQAELRDLNETNLPKLKEDLVKRMLQVKGINSKTTQETMIDIENCVRISKICIPKQPHEEIEKIIKKISDVD